MEGQSVHQQHEAQRKRHRASTHTHKYRRPTFENLIFSKHSEFDRNKKNKMIHTKCHHKIDPGLVSNLVDRV